MSEGISLVRRDESDGGLELMSVGKYDLFQLLTSDQRFSRANHERIEAMLARNQHLARTKFRFGPDRIPCIPLTFLISSRASLDVLRAVYELNPEAVYHHGRDRGYLEHLPLADAIWSRPRNAEVIQFLVDKYPKAVRTFCRGYLPLHVALGRRAPLETVLPLAQSFPEAIIEKCTKGSSCLEKAIIGYVKRDQRVGKFLFEMVPDHVQHVKLSNKEIYCCDTVSTWLAPLLPQLNSFVFEPRDWSMEGFSLLMSFLTQNLSIVSTKMKIPGHVLRVENGARNALSQFLSQNKVVEEVYIELVSNGSTGGNGANSDDLAFESIYQGLRFNEKIEELGLGCFRLDNSYLLHKLLMQKGTNLKILALYRINIYDKQWNTHQSSSFSTCPIEGLDIVDCSMPTACFQGFLNEIASMPVLKKLQIQCYPANSEGIESLDIATPIVETLNRGILQSLVTKMPKNYDMKVVCAALQGNTSLCKYHTNMDPDDRSFLFELLETHNATLMDVRFLASPSQYPPRPQHELYDGLYHQICHYATLNKIGRAKIRDPAASLDTFVGVIEKVSDDHKLLFGLLREVPVLWSDTTRS